MDRKFGLLKMNENFLFHIFSSELVELMGTEAVHMEG
jgi:hypothetical protein